MELLTSGEPSYTDVAAAVAQRLAAAGATANRLDAVVLSSFDKHLPKFLMGTSLKQGWLDGKVFETLLTAVTGSLTWEGRDMPGCEQMSLLSHVGDPKPNFDRNRNPESKG
ncbi:hypothetical protein UVI_02056080 [Ustilaginoidea virens]|uniref:Uncharacterized protein n=1 Tax=Ustilaginoidea virens TaxID=1159556 RepID=A0A1B5KY95_USTVR|nr:hypothetical protein UVI_02056080 [Ustilaginoidea virens]